MFREWKTRRMLKKGFHSIRIPEKENVLPSEALEQNAAFGKKENDFAPAYVVLKKKPSKYKKALAVLTSVLLVFASAVVVSMSFHYQVQNTNNTDSGAAAFTSDTDSEGGAPDTSDIVSNVPAEKPVITGDTFDYSFSRVDALLSSREVYISKKLKEKMAEYAGQDVLFRVIVEIQMTNEEMNEFLNNILYQSQDYTFEANAINALMEEIEEYRAYADLYEMYYNYLIDVKEKKIEITPEFDIAKQECERLEPYHKKVCELHTRISKIESAALKRYNEFLISDKLDYAISLGAQNVQKTEEISGYVPYAATYIMELSEYAITKLSERGGYVFWLAQSEEN